jgi:transposase
MVTIGIDPHKDTLAAAAVDRAGAQLGQCSCRARLEGFAQLLAWSKTLAAEQPTTWVIEDCRHVSGPLERFLLGHGQRVARLAPHLMADARRTVRQRGKSDPIDALAVARAALREGLDSLPRAELSGPEIDIRRLVIHRERLIRIRTAQINELRWELHDLWPELEIPKRRLILPSWQQRIRRRLTDAPQTVQLQIARDEITRIIALTKTINQLGDQLTTLVQQTAPDLLALKGMGPLIAAKLIGEIAGIHRFPTDAKLARQAGCAPVPVSSGRTDRHRLDRGGNRQLNHAIHLLALCRSRHHPQTADYLARQRANGKTHTEAMRNLKRQLIRLIWRLLTPHHTPKPTVLLT